MFVEENNSEYILKKGYLHQHSIAIDKEESSKNFIDNFKTLIAENQIELNENDDIIEDFNKLTQLNLIHQKIDTFNKICIHWTRVITVYGALSLEGRFYHDPNLWTRKVKYINQFHTKWQSWDKLKIKSKVLGDVFST